MAKMRLIIFVCGLYFSGSMACINSYEEELPYLMSRGNPEEIAATLERLQREHAKSPSIEVTTDLAVANIISGHYEVAVNLLRNLERSHPGLSRTASNLGTALELSGKNKDALHWIKEGVVRNPQDHEGTEWLHVKILEAKIALAEDPSWLLENNVLGVSFGTDSRPKVPTALPTDQFGKPLSLEKVEKAINYQLGERLKFVSAPDPLIGNIYFSRADIGYLSKTGYPPDYYSAALNFGAKNEALIKSRSAQYKADSQPRHKYEEPKRVENSFPSNVKTLLFMIILLAISGGIFYFRAVRAPSNKSFKADA